MDLSTQNSTFGLGQDEVDSQPTYDMPVDLDICVESIGRKKGRIFCLGSISKTLNPSSNQQTNKHANSEKIECFRSQVHALKTSLQRQEQKKLQMRQQMQRQGNQMSTLMKMTTPMKSNRFSCGYFSIFRRKIEFLIVSLLIFQHFYHKGSWF